MNSHITFFQIQHNPHFPTLASSILFLHFFLPTFFLPFFSFFPSFSFFLPASFSCCSILKQISYIMLFSPFHGNSKKNDIFIYNHNTIITPEQININSLTLSNTQFPGKCQKSQGLRFLLRLRQGYTTDSLNRLSGTLFYTELKSPSSYYTVYPHVSC